MSDLSLIACVDDDASVCEALVGFLRAHGMPADAYPSAEAFLESPRMSSAWCLIADIQLPGLSGLQLQARLATDGVHVPIIFVTAFPDAPTRQAALQSGAICFLHKPVTKEKLLACIETARARHQRDPKRLDVKDA